MVFVVRWSSTKTNDTFGLWALACAVVGPSASCGEEHSHKKQRAEVKLRVKSN